LVDRNVGESDGTSDGRIGPPIVGNEAGNGLRINVGLLNIF